LPSNREGRSRRREEKRARRTYLDQFKKRICRCRDRGEHGSKPKGRCFPIGGECRKRQMFPVRQKKKAAEQRACSSSSGKTSSLKSTPHRGRILTERNQTKNCPSPKWGRGISEEIVTCRRKGKSELISKVAYVEAVIVARKGGSLKKVGLSVFERGCAIAP